MKGSGWVARQNGPWTITGSARQYHNNFIDVWEDQVRQPDGQPGQYATVTMQPGVTVLALDRDGLAYLTRQFRYALGRESIEAISGALEEGETPRAAAEREAREELGITAEEWTSLGQIDMDTSVVRAPVQLFLARGLSIGETAREGSETISAYTVPFAEAVRLVLASEITHSPTCVTLLKADHILREEGVRGG